MSKRTKIATTTKVTGNCQVMSSPGAVRPLPEIAGPVTVSFKHESSIHGMAIGPVVVTASAPYEAWLKVHGLPHTNGRGETRYLVPFGAKPEGRHDLGWNTKTVAQEVASHYGVALEEF